MGRLAPLDAISRFLIHLGILSVPFFEHLSQPESVVGTWGGGSLHNQARAQILAAVISNQQVVYSNSLARGGGGLTLQDREPTSSFQKVCRDACGV